VQPHALDVELNRFADQLPRLFQGFAGGDTTRKVRDMCTVTCSRFLEEDRVTVHFRPACFSIDACVFGSKSPGVTGDRHGSRRGRMVILTVTATRPCQFPSVRLDQLDCVSDLHFKPEFVAVFVAIATGTMGKMP